MKRGIKQNKKADLILSLVGNRIYIESRTKATVLKVDVTPLWHFFKEVTTDINHSSK